MKKVILSLTGALLLTCSNIVNAQLSLNVAQSFAVLAGTSITNSLTTQIIGNIGTYTGTTITGFPPGVVTGGSIYPGTGNAPVAQVYCRQVYFTTWNKTPTGTIPASSLGGITLPPGVFNFPQANILLSGTLTLDGASNPNGQWIFLIKGNFDAAVSSQINLINGAQACNVYFIVGAVATLKDKTKFQGNILANEKIVLGQSVSNLGTLCAVNGPVSLLLDKLEAVSAKCVFR